VAGGGAEGCSRRAWLGLSGLLLGDLLLGCRGRTASRRPRFDPPTAIGASALPKRVPIEHVVIIVKENRSYDALFSRFPEGPSAQPPTDRCHEAMGDDDVPHGRELALHKDKQLRCHDKRDAVATYHELARRYTLCARFYSEVRGPSFPNHLMLIAAEAPRDDDPPVPPQEWRCPRYCYDYRTFAEQLEAAGRTWRSYNNTKFVSSFGMIRKLQRSPHVVEWRQFEKDARAGSLPSLSYVFSEKAESEHPPFDICLGQAWTLRQIRAVAEGPQWNKTAIFVTWDDWGGFHDHVRPPVVERDRRGRALRYGWRVPCLVISPFARRGHLSMEPHSHLSLLRFAADIFGLPPLNGRVASSSSMADCFDFTKPARPPEMPADPTCPRRARRG
jgi:phospholipase C